MRATTRSMPKISRATRATRMLELSPLVTAARAPASSMPAAAQAVAVEADADDGRAREALGQAAEGLRPPVDDGDGVALRLEGSGQAGADPTAARPRRRARGVPPDRAGPGGRSERGA